MSENFIQGDLSNKLMRGIKLEKYLPRNCNCVSTSKVNCKCIYNNDCRKCFLIYEAKCKICNQVYIGNTQQHFKMQMSQHFTKTWWLVNKNITSDTFANHFAQHCTVSAKGNLKPKHLQEMVELRIVWEGNPISCMKLFKMHGCVLCVKEQTEILWRNCSNPTSLINSANKIYGACQHHTNFHRYITAASADNRACAPERVSVVRVCTLCTPVGWSLTKTEVEEIEV